MLQPIFEYFEKLIEQFTWKRLLFTFIMLFTVCSFLVVYENYTGHFKLSRIESTINVLSKGTALPDHITEESKAAFSKVLKASSAELQEFAEGNATPFSIHPNVLKGLAALAPWAILLSLFVLIGSEDNRMVTGGILMVAIPFSLIGAFLPNFEHTWLNYWVYPIVHCAIVMFFIMLRHKRKNA